MSTVNLSINGTKHSAELTGDESLLSVLRNRLGLTGTKYGCGEGQCGACTVLIDGRATRSCLTIAATAGGKQIITIEGLAEKDKLHPVQQAFLDEEAFQCGYCTPGMIMSAVALLQSKPDPSDEDIIQSMNGNLCRCGTYPRIVAAIHRAGGKR